MRGIRDQTSRARFEVAHFDPGGVKEAFGPDGNLYVIRRPAEDSIPVAELARVQLGTEPNSCEFSYG